MGAWRPPEYILVTSLRHALDRCQRYLTLDLGAALFVLLIVLNATRAGETPLSDISLPSGLPTTSPLIAISLVLSVYWVSGAMASYMVARAKRIDAALHAHEALREAALTYPSIATIRVPLPRLLAATLPALLVLAAFIIEAVAQGTGSLRSFHTYFGLSLLASPYLTLVAELRHPVGGPQPHIPHRD